MAAAGWHGKLPTLSDFASRRLDARFVELWDQGLSSSLAALQAQEGGQWVAAYLACPTWRFLIGPGAVAAPFDACGWTGVVMPSVDRVGRYYPLLVAAPLDLMPQDAPAMNGLCHWLQRLEDAAVSALHDDWPLEQFEAGLFGLGLPHADASTLDALCPPPSAPFELFDSQQGTAALCFWHGRIEGGGAKGFTAPSLQEALCQLWTHQVEHT